MGWLKSAVKSVKKAAKKVGNAAEKAGKWIDKNKTAITATAAVVANFVPVVGQVASVGLAAVSAGMKAYETAKDVEKSVSGSGGGGAATTAASSSGLLSAKPSKAARDAQKETRQATGEYMTAQDRLAFNLAQKTEAAPAAGGGIGKLLVPGLALLLLSKR